MSTLNLLKNDYISAEQARNMTGIKSITVEDIMNDIKIMSESKRFEATYDLRDKRFDDGVMETLVSLGYSVNLKKFNDGAAYVTVDWYDLGSIKEQVEFNIPSYFKK